jgi:hypothetical protein
MRECVLDKLRIVWCAERHPPADRVERDGARIVPRPLRVGSGACIGRRRLRESALALARLGAIGRRPNRLRPHRQQATKNSRIENPPAKLLASLNDLVDTLA